MRTQDKRLLPSLGIVTGVLRGNWQVRLLRRMDGRWALANAVMCRYVLQNAGNLLLR
jgi:hypothetical protein